MLSSYQKFFLTSRSDLKDTKHFRDEKGTVGALKYAAQRWLPRRQQIGESTSLWAVAPDLENEDRSEVEVPISGAEELFPTNVNFQGITRLFTMTVDFGELRVES